MSHFTRLKTQIVEKELLTQALTDLGYTWEEGDLELRGFGVERTRVELKVKSGLLGHEIGFKKSGNTYAVVADWWGVRSAQRDQFLQKLNQRYAYHAARLKLEAQGFTLVNEETQPDGQVRLVLRRSV